MQKRTRGRAPKVDYRLLYKKQILDFLESMKNKNQTIWQMDECMRKLFRIGDQVVPVCLSKLRENDEELAPIICYALEFADDYSVVEPLLDILMMPKVSDRIKARILAVLNHYGVDASQLPIDMIMQDFDKIAYESMEEMLEDIQKDPFLIPYILDDFEDFSNDMKVAYIKDLGNHKDEKAILLLEILSSAPDVEVALASIKALGRIKSGKSLYVLSKIEKKAEDEDIQKLAYREMQRLKFSGISLEFYDPLHQVKCPEKIFISSIDGLGGRALWMAWKNPFKKGKLSFMNLLLNTDKGIKDCWGISNITLRELNSSVEEFSKTAAVIDCDLDYAIKLVSDALLLNQNSNSPIPYQFIFWKHLLEHAGSSIYGKHYQPSFADCDLQVIGQNETYFNKTFDLYDSIFFKDWFIAHPRVYDYAEEVKSKKNYVIKKLTKEKLENLFSSFSKELILPNKNRIKRMLELSADFLIQAGQTEIAEIALCAFLNMDLDPLYHNPFIQKMIMESIKVALNNMKNGYDMRVNPDEFL